MSDRPSVRLAGWVGFVAAALFLLSIATLQALRPDITWTTHYVSDFVNGPAGWLFVVATLVHGIGNFALAIGIGKSLQSVELGQGASALLAMSAIGILVAALFRTDPANASITWVGFVHGSAVTASFLLELAALFLLSMTFRRSPLWRLHARTSFGLAVAATAGLVAFVVLRELNQLQGLGERAALLAFMTWELWASFRLTRSLQRHPAHV